MLSRFHFPTEVIFGEGAVEAFAEEASGRGLRSALVVSDPGVVKAGLTERVREALAAVGIGSTVFDEVHTNPREAEIYAGADRWQESGADCIVAVGGGAAIDTAKGVRLLASHPPPLGQYDDARGGSERIGPEMPPLFALPTTAGTGSEVGRSFVVTLEDSRRKTVIFSPHLMPTVAVCDPRLTVGLPPAITAATGMDALTHNVEAYLAKGFHPLADAIAIRGTALVSRYLVRAVKRGDDMEARSGMMAAALMGATAFQKGLGVCHSLAHAIGAETDLHHGLANALCLAAVLRFNAEAVPERVEDIATALGASSASYGREPGERAAARVRELCRGAGLPSGLAEAGVDPGLVPALVELAFADGCHLENPRPVTRTDLQALLEASM
ncbi:MAG: iron-containing alcohol dehydrogenase [Deltaproteobacteria bacterium]|nr:MAG: iron-containing alcohol dehydrogenase [Deltaproteobacteria bacterium]